MRAVLRVDASSAIGSGHLSRCLTLARGLAARGFEVEIATRAPSERVLAWIAREGHRAVPIDAATIDEDVVATRRAAEGAALVVVDGYVFDAAYHDALRADGRVVCVLDDLAASRVGGDAVLNGNVYGEELSYDVRDGARLLVGPRFALVRDEFVAARAPRVARKLDPARRPRLLVTMGGADPTSETEKALAALEHVSAMDVRVIVGGANPRADAIREAASRAPRRHDVEVLVDVRTMGEQMVWCDVALAAAGSTCLELACVGVASVVVVVVDNQRLVGDGFGRRGLMTNLGAREAVDAETMGRAVEALVVDETRRRAMEEGQRAVVDGAGKDRAAEELARLAAAGR
jgi:UDP-2,4-diacetamido-2,4,6-trideoxy-beta-L-altropyranose hydrolase